MVFAEAVVNARSPWGDLKDLVFREVGGKDWKSLGYDIKVYFAGNEHHYDEKTLEEWKTERYVVEINGVEEIVEVLKNPQGKIEKIRTYLNDSVTDYLGPQGRVAEFLRNYADKITIAANGKEVKGAEVYDLRTYAYKLFEEPDIDAGKDAPYVNQDMSEFYEGLI